MVFLNSFVSWLLLHLINVFVLFVVAAAIFVVYGYICRRLSLHSTHTHTPRIHSLSHTHIMESGSEQRKREGGKGQTTIASCGVNSLFNSIPFDSIQASEFSSVQFGSVWFGLVYCSTFHVKVIVIVLRHFPCISFEKAKQQ